MSLVWIGAVHYVGLVRRLARKRLPPRRSRCSLSRKCGRRPPTVRHRLPRPTARPWTRRRARRSRRLPRPNRNHKCPANHTRSELVSPRSRPNPITNCRRTIRERTPESCMRKRMTPRRRRPRPSLTMHARESTPY